MTNYWPSDLNLEDTSSPLEIIKDAKQEWRDQSDGQLILVIQEAESSNKNDMMIVHAKHAPSNRTVTLFSVIHRLGSPYPARIQPQGDELPDAFKKSYYQHGFAELASLTGTVTGRNVTNEWICDTPSEFRSKLQKVFNLGTLKADVLSLVSGAAPDYSEAETREPDEPKGKDTEEAEP